MLHIKECVYVVRLVEGNEKEKEQRDYQCVDNDLNPFRYLVMCTHVCTASVGTKVRKICQTSLKTAFNPCMLLKFNKTLVPITVFS